MGSVAPPREERAPAGASRVTQGPVHVHLRLVPLSSSLSRSLRPDSSTWQPGSQAHTLQLPLAPK